MPQEFHVLRCYSCSVFQVHIVKKSNKWQCKMCNEKQSLKKVYGQGTGKDCRLHVQKLNSLQITSEETSKLNSIHFAMSTLSSAGSNSHQYSEDESYTSGGFTENEVQSRNIPGAKEVATTGGESKWSHYVEVKQQTPDTDPEDDIFVLEQPKIKRRKLLSQNKQNSDRARSKNSNSFHADSKLDGQKCPYLDLMETTKFDDGPNEVINAGPGKWGKYVRDNQNRKNQSESDDSTDNFESIPYTNVKSCNLGKWGKYVLPQQADVDTPVNLDHDNKEHNMGNNSGCNTKPDKAPETSNRWSKFLLTDSDDHSPEQCSIGQRMCSQSSTQDILSVSNTQSQPVAYPQSINSRKFFNDADELSDQELDNLLQL